MESQIHTTLEDGGLLVATIDMPGRRMNVFSLELIEALDALMDRVDQDPSISCVVLTSGKPTFLAGAELTMVRGFTDSAKTFTPAALRALCGRLGRQFVRLENSGKPWVAAVNGLALGGGLELAAACRERFVTDDPKTQLGTPEVRWGLLPGAGGTQRLPRFAGFEAGMKLLLSGQSIGPAEAVALHMFERAVPAAQLLDEAKKRALELRGSAYDPKTKFANLEQADVPPPGTKVGARFGVSDADLRDYPAYQAIIDSVLEGARMPLAEATEVEMTQFLTLMVGPVARRMVKSLYLDKLNADKAAAPPAETGIERIGVGALPALWTEALAKSKLAIAAAEDLPKNTLEIVDRGGQHHRVTVTTVESPDAGTLVLSKAGPYGRVLEIVGTPEPVLAFLAQRLGALPWRTPEAVLQRLHGKPLDEQARIADVPFLDVAACLSGVSPAWSGGPLTLAREKAGA